jgi:S1-C subfamily serine protease
VTNNHVVDFADQLEVTLHDGRVFDAVKVGTYPNADIAVIKIKADDLKPIKYGNSDDVKVGEWALAVGNPFDLTSTVTAGIISAKGRSIDVIHTKDAVENFIQTDAAVNPGNSGGALVDVNGNLIESILPLQHQPGLMQAMLLLFRSIRLYPLSKTSLKTMEIIVDLT